VFDHEKLAKLLVNIRYEPLAEKAALAVFKEVTLAGGHAVFQSAPDGVVETLIELGTDAQLDHLNELAYWCRAKPDVEIIIRASANTKALSTVNSERLSRRMAAQKPTASIFMNRQATGALRWVLTDFPTEAYAQDFGTSLIQFEDFVSRAMMLHLDDPIAWWQQFGRWQQSLIDDLGPNSDRVHLKGPNSDLKMSIKGKTWDNCACYKNAPDGEFFTGPVPNSVNGWLRMAFPTHYLDHVVEDVYLRFKNGVIVEATASKGEDFLVKTLNTDRGARRLGELGIGTNPMVTKPTKQILFDEKMVGTFHVAAGRGYPNTGNHNKSAVHWDFIVPIGDGTITIDGRPIFKDGDFVIGDPSLKPAFTWG
jgi:aminopeptidase